MIQVKTISAAIVKGYREIKSLWGANNTETSRNVEPFGFESNPVKGLIAITAETLSNEDPVVVGYLNKKAVEALESGESIHYATDDNGDKKATITLRKDGTAEMLGTGDFMVRYNALKTAYNELQEKMNDLVTAFNQHVHLAPSGSTAPPTAVPFLIPATASDGDITAAKIEEIKTI